MNKALVVLMVAVTVLTVWKNVEREVPPPQIVLEKGDHIVLLGNTLAERMQHHGWLESYVQAALPQREIVFRNHGFSGDTVSHRPRNKGFPTPHTYLDVSEADVVLALGTSVVWQRVQDTPGVMMLAEQVDNDFWPGDGTLIAGGLVWDDLSDEEMAALLEDLENEA